MSKNSKLLFVIMAFLMSHCSSSFAIDTVKNTDLLFSKSGVHLSAKDRISISKQMGFTLSNDKKHFVDELNTPVTVTVKEVDLDDDGISEVFVTIQGSTVISGDSGSSIALFMKIKGAMRKQFEVPAFDYTVMGSMSKSYSDLCFGGPGEKFPVWRWNGHEYKFSHTTNNCN